MPEGALALVDESKVEIFDVPTLKARKSREVVWPEIATWVDAAVSHECVRLHVKRHAPESLRSRVRRPHPLGPRIPSVGPSY